MEIPKIFNMCGQVLQNGHILLFFSAYRESHLHLKTQQSGHFSGTSQMLLITQWEQKWNSYY